MKSARKTTLIAIVAASLLAAFVLAMLYYPKMTKGKPSVSLSEASAAGAEVNPGAESSVLEYAVVTPDTVQQVVASMSREDTYHRTVSVESFWSGGSSKDSVEVWKRLDAVRVSVKSEEGGEKNYILTGDKVYIWYGSESEYYSGASVSALGSLTEQADLFMLTQGYEQLAQMDKSAVKDAGYIEYEGEMCIFAEVTEPELGYTEKYYVSVRTGLLFALEVFDGETPVYRMSSVYTEITEPSDEAFILPDGASVLPNS